MSRIKTCRAGHKAIQLPQSDYRHLLAQRRLLIKKVAVKEYQKRALDRLNKGPPRSDYVVRLRAASFRLRDGFVAVRDRKVEVCRSLFNACASGTVVFACTTGAVVCATGAVVFATGAVAFASGSVACALATRASVRGESI